MERFKGKTVIVTGASSGIGRGVAERFSQEGANVVICARHEDKLQQVAKQLPQDRTLAQVADVSTFADVESLVAAAVTRFGGLDVIVNNAGIGTEGDALTCSSARAASSTRRRSRASPGTGGCAPTTRPRAAW